MPFATCWQKLLQSIVAPIITILNAPNIQRPIAKFNTINFSATANTNIVNAKTEQQIQATNPPCLFRIYVVLQTSGVFSVMRTAGNATQTESLNAGSPLNANVAYMFDILVDQNEFIDFQTNATGIISKLAVYEKDDAK